MKQLIDLLKTSLSAYQVARELREKDIRLSTFGWSKYYLEDGMMVYHHHYGHQEYDVVVESIEELKFFDDEQTEDFEYPQEITADMVKALRSLSF